MLSRRNLILLILAIACIANTALIVGLYQKSNKTVVIDIMKVVGEFHLKKDLEGRAAQKLTALTNEIDSLSSVRKFMASNGASEPSLVAVDVQIDTLRNRTQRAYLSSNQAINEQIWLRLNSLLTEYGKQYGYELVVGANGMGTVLYSEDHIDKTSELIAFINKRYDNGR